MRVGRATVVCGGTSKLVEEDCACKVAKLAGDELNRQELPDP